MITTKDISDRFCIDHRKVTRSVKSIIKMSIFPQSEIIDGEYISSRGKTYPMLEMSERVAVYLVSSYRCFRSTPDRLSACGDMLEGIGVNFDIVVGDSTRNETMFGAMLCEFMSGFVVIPQHYIGGYYIDFYIPDLNIAVEYDERYHDSRAYSESDRAREKSIDDCFLELSDGEGAAPKWVRVRQGSEIAGIRKIVDSALEEGMGSYFYN